MNGKEFAEHLLNSSREVAKYVSEEAPIVMGNTAVAFYKEGFQKEGFTDAAFEPWDEVKRRLDPLVTGAKATRKILTGDSGVLGRSIDKKNASNGEVTIYTDLEYAEAHNSGTTNAGRNRSVTIPKRKFIGKSEQLDKLIIEELQRKIGPMLKK